MSDWTSYCLALGRQAKDASRTLALAATARKNAWLLRTADTLENEAAAIRDANADDVREAIEGGLPKSRVDRLQWTRERVQETAHALREVAGLPEPIGQIRETNVRPNGLEIRKVGVPFGVILFIYESRPNVTVDAAGLAVKSGNAIILRGGSEAARTNRAVHALLAQSLQEEGLPPHAVQFVDTSDRAAVGCLLRLQDYIDLVIPRGGEELIARVAAEARMPVLKHDRGNCHVYVDRTANLDMALQLLLNSKCQRPGVCNAAESLLVHRDAAGRFLPKAIAELRMRGVEVRGCERTCRVGDAVIRATEADFAAEYLDLILSVKVVDDLAEAIEHIERFGSHHTDAIVTEDEEAAAHFLRAIDSAAVLHNASTRFNDGSELGLGAEIGISTGKFHARGPCGLLELTSYKYVIRGTGQVRGEPSGSGT